MHCGYVYWGTIEWKLLSGLFMKLGIRNPVLVSVLSSPHTLQGELRSPYASPEARHQQAPPETFNLCPSLPSLGTGPQVPS